MEKILIFENDPQYFEKTELYKWLIKHKIKDWDFACTLEWELTDVLKCGFDLIEKYDCIATETYFGHTKRLIKDENFHGGQIKEMMCLLESILPLRKKPLTVYYSQLVVSGKKIDKDYLIKYFMGEDFIRFSSTTNFVLSHPMLNLKILNLHS